MLLYTSWLLAQFSKIEKATYPILCTSPEKCISSVQKLVAKSDVEFDFIFFDLPGSVNNPAVLETLSPDELHFHPHRCR